jgi:hypothetical protein
MQIYKDQHDYVINLGKTIREYRLYYDFNVEKNPQVLPCRVKIEWDGNVYDTGFLGSSEYNEELVNLGFSPVVGSNSTGYLLFNKNKQEPVTAKVTVYTPIKESMARINLVCCDLGCQEIQATSYLGDLDDQSPDGGGYGFMYVVEGLCSNYISYVLPWKEFRNLQGDEQANIVINGDCASNLTFDKYLLKSNQMSLRDENNNNISTQISSGSFGFRVEVSEDTIIRLSGNFESQNINLYYDLFNQNHNINGGVYNFYRDWKSSSSEGVYKNWGLLRCLMQTNVADWGTENDWE